VIAPFVDCDASVLFMHISSRGAFDLYNRYIAPRNYLLQIVSSSPTSPQQYNMYNCECKRKCKADNGNWLCKSRDGISPIHADRYTVISSNDVLDAAALVASHCRWVQLDMASDNYRIMMRLDSSRI
jgi:hypothetical protein